MFHMDTECSLYFLCMLYLHVYLQCVCNNVSVKIFETIIQGTIQMKFEKYNNCNDNNVIPVEEAYVPTGQAICV